MALSDREASERAARVESLLERLESVEEPARSLATEALQALMDLYGEALARIVAHVPADTLAGDEVVAHVLLLHDLHPVDAETRVTRALGEIRPSLAAQGADVELLGVAGGVARVRMRARGQGCATMAIRTTIESSIRNVAPDLDHVEVEVEEPPPPLIPVESIKLRTAGRSPARAVA
jgi:Fe-S cluster biogenesis protein NfuA